MTSTADAVARVQDLGAMVDAHSTDADRAGRLASPVVKAMHDQGLFRILLPRQLGGSELDVGEALPVFEAAGRLDGAVGWTLAIGSVTLLVLSERLPPEQVGRVLGDECALVAGGVQPGAVTARRVPGGYRFSGRVGFASGSAHATWLLAAGTRRGSSPAEGLVAGLFEPEAATMLDSWHVSGMRATSSADFVLDNAFVPDDLTFPLDLGPPPDGAIAALPMASMLGVALAFVALGISTHAHRRFVSLATSRTPFGSADTIAARPDVQIAAARARSLVDAGRAYVDATWRDVQTALADGSATVDHLARLRLSFVTATQNAIAATDLSWVHAGSSAIYEGEALERCWRDVHVVGQHHFVSVRHLDRVGRITLGLAPGPGPI